MNIYNFRWLVPLAMVAVFITGCSGGPTGETSSVKTISDLKGKRVVVGPAGAGFEMFLKPILEEHGVTYDDFSPLHSGQSGAVDMLSDGAAAAAFLGGAVPTGSITQACATNNIFFVPYEEDAVKELLKKYPFFERATIPKDAYSDLIEDYQGLNVGSMHLITNANVSEEVVYQITKTIYENAEAVIEKHPAGRAIEKRATRNTGIDFHPGAIRFYKKKGIWPEDASEPDAVESSNDTPEFISIGTAPIGGAFAQVGGALAEVLNDKKGENPWSVQAQGTKGSQENIRLLDNGKIELALSNAAISYFASKGEATWDKKYEIRAVMTLAPNIAMFITKQSKAAASSE